MIGLFELGVADKGFAVFAPVFGLKKGWSDHKAVERGRSLPTVDFQYSDMVGDYM